MNIAVWPAPHPSPDVDALVLSSLIGEIYDAALDHTLWPSVLESVAHFVDGMAAGLLSKSTVSSLGQVHHNYGVEARYLQSYGETYWRYDPLAPLTHSEVGEVTGRLDFLPDVEFREGRFYREWVAPQGAIDAANVVLDKSSTGFALLSVIRSEAQGLVDETMRERLELLVPHLRRAVLIGKVIDLNSANAALLPDMLNLISAGVFLVDAEARIVHTNPAGRDLLAAGDLLRSSDGVLTVRDRDANNSLVRAVAATQYGDAVMADSGVAVPLTSWDGEHFVAHVLPMNGGLRRDARRGHAVSAAVFVHRAEFTAPTAPEAIAKAFSLTPMELRVLLAIVNVGGVPEVADALGIGEATVKTHLHRVFSKTGSSRQADLVKLVAGFSSPLSR